MTNLEIIKVHLRNALHLIELYEVATDDPGEELFEQLSGHARMIQFAVQDELDVPEEEC